MDLLTVREQVPNTTRFTTGDSILDNLLDGGIRPGVITELVGESGSGKTQLALQLSLCVQLPIQSGGLSASACYLTTNGSLQTFRLVEIIQNSPTLTSESCSLDDIHTRSCSSVPEFKHVLLKGIPSLAEYISKKPAAKPLRLLVLDSIGALFRPDSKTSRQTLFDRSREIVDIASMLHHLASSSHLAIIVINEVINGFTADVSHESNTDELLYSHQARWFSRSDNAYGEKSPEAALGLAWANQVGVRMVLNRTKRRRYIGMSGQVRRRHERAGESEDIRNPVEEEEATPIRQLSIIFSTFSSPGSVDFVVTRSGIMCHGGV